MIERIIVAAVIRDGKKILFGKKAGGRGPFPDAWNLPGGGVEDFERATKLLEEGKLDDEYFHSELRREIMEETALEIKNIANIVPKYRAGIRIMEAANRYGIMQRYNFLEYLCDYKSGDAQAGDDLVDVKWFEEDVVSNMELTKPSQELFRELKII